MAKSQENDEKQNTSIDIKDSLTIYQTADLREKFLAILDIDQDVIVDLHELEDWDIAGLQLLVSLQKTVVKSGKNLCIQQAPAAFLETFEALGLNRKDFQID